MARPLTAVRFMRLLRRVFPLTCPALVLLVLVVSCRESPTDPDPPQEDSFSPVWDIDTTVGTVPVISLDTGPGGMMTIVVGTGTVMISSNHGTTWSTSTPAASVRAVLALPSSRVIAASVDHGVFRTSDLGVTWQRISDGLQDSSVFTLGKGPGELIFAGTRTGLIFQSSNGGEYWHQRFYLDALITAFCPTHSDTMLVGTWGYGVFGFTATGGTAGPLNDGLLDPYILALASGPEEDSFAGTSDAGIYRSTDHGHFWQSTSDSLRHAGVTAIVADATGLLLAGTGHGVFMSKDRGIHWATADSGLGTPSISSLRIADDGSVFASTETGLYRARQRLHPQIDQP